MFLLLCTISEKRASGIFIRNALSIRSAIFDRCLSQGAEMADYAHRSLKFQRYVASVARSRQIAPDQRKNLKKILNNTSNKRLW